jgi:hypothetical protein
LRRWFRSLPHFARDPLLSWHGSLPAALLAVACLAATVSAAAPRDELLRLVPEDVGFCLALEDLRGHGSALADSPFVKQFQTSSLGAKIRSAPETQKLTALDEFLQTYLDVTATQLRDDILGEALVLAYRPGPPGKADQEEGLFLLRARDAKLLTRIVDRINALQKESGDLQEVEERAYHGETYYRRQERGSANYYYLHGPVLAFAPREGILRQLIDLDRNAPKDAECFVARQFRLLGIARPVAALWINPRAFDAALQQKAAAATGAPAIALRTLAAYWKGLEGIALSASLERDLALSLAVRARIEELPRAAQRFLHAAASTSEVWQRFPDNCLLSIAGRVDIAAFVEALGDFLADDARKSVRAMIENTVEAIGGKDIIKDLLANLGPDYGICVLAPPASDSHWLPHMIAALRVRSGTASVPVELVVWNALNSLATLAVFHHNHGHPGQFSLKSIVQDKMEVRYLESDEQFPPGLQPAFALKGGYLVLASSPAALQRFRASPKETQLPLTGEVPLLKVSLSSWCQFLRERREPLLAYAAVKNQISREQAGQHLDQLLMFLQLFDRVELIQRSNAGLVTLTLRVQTAKPVR